MNKKIFYITILFFIVCMMTWWYVPVHFLSEIEPEEVVAIKVFNGNNGDEFEIISPNDISVIMNHIKQITFKKDSITSGIDYWYTLTFINENREEIESLSVQNHRIMRKDIAQKWSFFYHCDNELSAVGDYLESLEAIQFPDYNKDPDFSDF